MHGVLDWEIYMKQPRVSKVRLSKLCVQLKKALYNNKNMVQKNAIFLVQNGYLVTSTNLSLFFNDRDNKSVIILVYVYDLITIENDEK